MTSVLIGGKQRKIWAPEKSREGREEGSRDRNYAAIRNAGGPCKSEEARKDSPLEPLEEVRPYCGLDFGPVATKSLSEQIPAMLSPSVCDNLSWQP